ncbi:hypothetical protein QVG61_13300 [Thiohalobacter sp. IOR34]|uniref:hypothetical protein n=1 Tax=Thiohalobacter sp. IOR34 TaxID=3057176 RepID=UPI0025AEEE00|nr:hypothetical protein [Thiohalobacter sp. IOR34]WJW75446.1 hypothetical protein QVG61_13300 [Thiohalobacter sp. IOR34]
MPASAAEPAAETLRLAVTAEVLYLANLLLLPLLAFLALLYLYRRHRASAPDPAACHLRQTLSASLWAGLLLVAANLLIVALGGYDAPYTWLVVILYFTVCHSTLVMLGIFGLARAMAGQCVRFPLLGRFPGI